jgi:hypothetical protein
LLEGSRVPSKPAKGKVTLTQSEFPGGIRIWGSNPAILWTSSKAELDGVHLHAYKNDDDLTPEIDETFASVTIDDVDLTPEAVRTLMAQSALPHLSGRVVTLRCPTCNLAAFDEGALAFAPEASRKCRNGCRTKVLSRGRFRKVVSNPLVGALSQLAETAVRAPRRHDLELLPETL